MVRPVGGPLGQLRLESCPVVTGVRPAEIEALLRTGTTQRPPVCRRLLAALGFLAEALVLGGRQPAFRDSTSFRSLLYYARLDPAARLRRKPVLLWGPGGWGP